MRQTLKSLVARIGKGEKGFTLIEMLVVVGIIVALAAVIVPTVIKFTDEGQTGAQNAELDAVQAAVDVWMADQKIPVIDARALIAAAPIERTTVLLAGEASMGEYLRDEASTYSYYWDITGLVTQVIP